MLRKALALLAFSTSALGASAGFGQDAGPASERVLVVLAHPDDELVMAPAIARAVREGAALTVVYATSGDVGPGVSGMEPGPELAAVREDEARCSIDALGGGDLRFLQLGDGQLATQAQQPGSAARRLASAVDALLDGEDFARILTWGPDGGYGHPDHRMVHAVVSERVQARGEDRPLLLYPGIAAGTLPDIPQMQAWAATAADLLPVSYAYEAADLDRARKATDCHSTQFSAEERAALTDLFDQTIWRGSVHFRPAFAPSAAPGEPSGD
ncbi:PIG-L deacetylase family protein [Qipengyuania sp.]|uniref:PIG-L deacetylase family protein n=1 Tax=Qipengyuania sp. TaxID=2004515 RepID=UPI003AF78570